MRAALRRPVEVLLTGAAGGDGAVVSGNVKHARRGAVWVSRTGLQGDEQGDRVFHGGPDKALHHYAADHYPLWRVQLPGSPVALAAGAFGETFLPLA